MDSSKDSIKLGAVGKKEKSQDNEIAEILKKFAENPEVINEKLMRCKFVSFQEPSEIPPCFLSNSPKEELVLEHVKEFERHFPLVFRQQQDRQLYLFPPNECGLQKFICTTIRPTKLGYLELYNYDSCATTIARYLQYEELDPADKYPKVIPSPSNVLEWQKGDCFDFRVGYDAYVVFGVAPRAITSCNEALLENPHSTEIQEPKDDEIEQEVQEITNNYTIKEQEEKKSTFDKQVKEELKQKKIRKHRMETVIDDYEPNKMGLDLFRNKRKHAWILIKAGKRKVKDHFFIEPSTGRPYALDKSEYLSIDAVFNNQNYWINIKQKNPVSEVNFDNMNKNESPEWEYVMLDTLDIPYNLNDEFNHPDDMDESALEQKALRAMKQILDMPPPWPPKLIIPYEKYRLGSPLGEETKFYVKSKVDIYGESYNENKFQIDGLVKQITIYEDFLRNIVDEIQYYYKNRKDKLYLRVRQPFLFTTIDYYGPGKQNCWKKVIYQDRRRREIIYYPNKNDPSSSQVGIMRRVEEIGFKTTEYYQNRDDKVIERSINFKPAEEFTISQKSNLIYQIDDHNLKKKCFITSMVQKMDFKSGRPPNEQISKMMVDLVKRRIHLYYHLNKGEFAPKVESMDRNELSSRITENNKNVENPQKEENNRNILNLEKNCYNTMKSSDELTKADLAAKYNNDQYISTYMGTNDHEMAKELILEKSLADKARDNLKKKQLQKEQQIGDEMSPDDPLLPYLAGKSVEELNPQDKSFIKSQIMETLKNRILNRGDIIHKRLEGERIKLKKLRAELTKKQDATSPQEQKQNEEEIKDLEFRVKILDSRAYKFQMNALEKYTAMDQKLSKDLKMNIGGND